MDFQVVGYKIDIAFVLDATGGMGFMMEWVKSRVLEFGPVIRAGLEAAGKKVEQMRVRVIDFADFATEGEDALRQSDFYTIPEESEKFREKVCAIDYDCRGGDMPENSLEALYAAMNSDWVKIGPGEKGRHIIVVITDAQPLNLHEREGSIGYPGDNLPADLAEMEAIWCENDPQKAKTRLSHRNKRLILFVPADADEDGHSWHDVMAWEDCTVTDFNTQKVFDCNKDHDIILEGAMYIVNEIIR